MSKRLFRHAITVLVALVALGALAYLGHRWLVGTVCYGSTDEITMVPLEGEHLASLRTEGPVSYVCKRAYGTDCLVSGEASQEAIRAFCKRHELTYRSAHGEMDYSGFASVIPDEKENAFALHFDSGCAFAQGFLDADRFATLSYRPSDRRFTIRISTSRGR